MTQQYLRKANLVLNLANVTTGNTVLDLSEMHFTFQTQAQYVGTPNSCIIRVFNLKRDTALSVVKEGSQLFLSAGYEGNFGQIFQGNIVQARIGRNGTDSYLDITASDGDTIYNDKIVSANYAAGTNALGRLGQLANSAKITTGVINVKTDDAKLHRGKTVFGLLRDHLDDLCGTIGANWKIENGVLDVIAQNAYKDDSTVPELGYLTGVIGVPEQMELGISIRVLLNPNISANKKIHLDNETMVQQYQFSTDFKAQIEAGWMPELSSDGFYKVLYVKHVGDTRGQDWYTDIIGYNDYKLLNPSQLIYLTENRIQY